MIINNFSERDDGTQFFVEADVHFEVEARTQKIFYAVPSAQAAWLQSNPDAFMLGTAIAASWAGETRLKIEAPVDQQLAARLILAMRLLAHWWGPQVQPIHIESEGFRPLVPDSTPKQTGIFLSGGVDSFAALLWNTDQYPLGHPMRVTVAFFVYGIDVGDPNKPDRHDVFAAGRERLASLCTELGVELVPLHVNLRSLGADWRLYAKWQFGSLLASMAHAASHRLTRMIIASDNVIEYIGPYGSHPWLNSYYNSDTLTVSTGDTEQFTRLERVRILTRHPETLLALRVCWVMDEIPEGGLNCGHCTKCVRTLLELVACGANPQDTAFPVKDVTPKMLQGTRLDFKDEYYTELPLPLRAAHRPDLAEAVEGKLRAWRLREMLGLNYMRPKVRNFLNALRSR
jgi:hypothetical protein